MRLNLGFIAVRNRKQEESDLGISTEELRSRERHFFTTFKPMAGAEASLWGTHTLVARIVQLQSVKVDEFSAFCRFFSPRWF